jgi:hypothetical protein
LQIQWQGEMTQAAFWTLGLVPQIRVPEARERMVSSFMCPIELVHKVQLLSCWVQMATDGARVVWKENSKEIEYLVWGKGQLPLPNLPLGSAYRTLSNDT